MKIRDLTKFVLIVAAFTVSNLLIASSIAVKQVVMASSVLKRPAVSEYSPLWPILKKVRTEKITTIPLLHVAQYFVDKHRSSGGLITNITLGLIEKELYCAQGYALAILGERLFDDSIIQQDDTALFQAVRNQIGLAREGAGVEKTIIEENMILAADFKAQSLDERHKTLLDCIFEMIQNSPNDTSLFARNKEDSQQNGILAEVDIITCQKSFRQALPWVTYVTQLIKMAKTEAQLVEMTQYIREYISYSYMTHDNLTAIRDYLESKKADLERALEAWDSAQLIKWPHLTRFESWMGYIFYPLQYEYATESPLSLQIRIHMQLLLAISCSYNYTPSIVCMAHVFEHLSRNDYDEDISSLELVKKYFGKQQAKIVENSLKLPSELTTGLPPYFCGRLCLDENDSESADAWFSEGMKKNDILCTFECGTRTNNQQVRIECCSRLSQSANPIAKALAKIIASENSNSEEIKISLLEEAGALGLSYAFARAGDICARSPDNKLSVKAYQLYLLAAQNHVLEAYKNVAEFCMKRRDALEDKDSTTAQEYHKLAKDYLLLAANKGNTLAYFDLVNIYHKEGKAEKSALYWKLFNPEDDIEKIKTLRSLIDHGNKNH